MAKQKSITTETTPDDGTIGPHNWVRLAQQGVRNRGGEGFVIYAPGHPAATPAPWHAWLTWMDQHGIRTAFARVIGIATVPTQWPEEFDLGAPPSDRSLTAPKPVYIGPERRKEMADMLRGILGPMPEPKAAEAPKRSLEEIGQESLGPISPELAANLKKR